jgi:hypothetical protein
MVFVDSLVLRKSALAVISEGDVNVRLNVLLAALSYSIPFKIQDAHYGAKSKMRTAKSKMRTRTAVSRSFLPFTALSYLIKLRGFLEGSNIYGFF